MQRFERHIGLRSAIGNDRRIRIKLQRRRSHSWRRWPARMAHALKWPRARWGMNQRAREWLAALDRSLAPHILLRAFGCWHPWTARFAPAGRARNGLFQTQLIGKSRGVFERILPLWGHVRHAVIHHLGCGQGRIKILEPGNAHRSEERR